MLSGSQAVSRLSVGFAGGGRAAARAHLCPVEPPASPRLEWRRRRDPRRCTVRYQRGGGGGDPFPGPWAWLIIPRAAHMGTRALARSRRLESARTVYMMPMVQHPARRGRLLWRSRRGDAVRPAATTRCRGARAHRALGRRPRAASVPREPARLGCGCAAGHVSGAASDSSVPREKMHARRSWAAGHCVSRAASHSSERHFWQDTAMMPSAQLGC